MPLLRFLSADGSVARERFIDETETSVSLGRDEAADVAIDDPKVSRRHASITKVSEGYLLADEGSANGTEVNGKRIDRCLLEHGDRLLFGRQEVEFVYQSECLTLLDDDSGEELHCPACRSANPPGDKFCKFCGSPLASPERRPEKPEPRLVTRHGDDAARRDSRPNHDVGRSPLQPAVTSRTPLPAAAGSAKSHRPAVALGAGLLIPGAGQAYNGQAIKGFFLFFASVLVVPWLYSLFDAFRTADRMAAEGGRRGRGGPIWIILQGWLFACTLLFVVILLTMRGILQ